jgi:hypothetical protein
MAWVTAWGDWVPYNSLDYAEEGWGEGVGVTIACGGVFTGAKKGATGAIGVLRGAGEGTDVRGTGHF